nr:DUF2269 family protein [Scopulibacillus darangshiensis]
MIFYKLLVVIHVLSAIIGLGPGFVFIPVLKSAQTMKELKHAYRITRKMHQFIMAGGFLLLATGLSMGTINPGLFKLGWYDVSLILFFAALAMGPIILTPRSKRIKKLIETYEGDDIPETYIILSKDIFFWERILNVLFIVIIVLMITKPF